MNHDVKVKNVLIEEERERFREKETGDAGAPFIVNCRGASPSQ